MIDAPHPVYFNISLLIKYLSAIETLISSPGHKVLGVSYIVITLYPSSVNNFFKHLLLLNHWVNLDETWQGYSLGEALRKFFKEFNSIRNSDCHGNLKEKPKGKKQKQNL